MNRTSMEGRGANGAPKRYSSSGRWLRGGRWTVAAGTTLLAVATFAADDSRIIFPGGGGASGAPAPSGGGAGANTFTLIAALLFAAVGGWLFWRNRRSTGIGREGRLLAVEETKSLGNRQYLVVASYSGKKFLLGVCPGRIEMLTPLSDSESGRTDR